MTLVLHDFRYRNSEVNFIASVSNFCLTMVAILNFPSRLLTQENDAVVIGFCVSSECLIGFGVLVGHCGAEPG